MRSFCVFAFVATSVALCLVGSDSQQSVAREKKTKLSRTKPAQKRVLRHVVLFKFKQTATKKQIQHVVREFAALPQKIESIIAFERGTNISVENFSKGFTHGFVVTFRNEKGRKVYLPHPAHERFKKIVGPLLEDVLVFDYWTMR